MNIALVVEAPFPPVSRANLRLHRLGLALANRGYRTHMVSPSFYPHSRERGSHSKIHVVQHVGLAAFLYSSFIRIFATLFNAITSVIALVGLHKSTNLHVMHAWHPMAGLAVVLAGRLTRTRVFLDWTDFYSDIVRYESKWLTPIAQRIERFILSNSDRVFTVSEEMKKALVEVGALSNKIYVVPDGVDCEVFNPKVDGSAIRRKYVLGDSPTIIFHGDVKPIDGVDVLVKAFALVVKRLPNAKLLIVGGGREYFRKVVRLTEKLGVNSSVIFTGWVQHEKVPEHIAAADVGVMPLRSTLETNCYLSFKLFEYWAMGKPVVASRVKAISKIIKNDVNGVLVEPEDVESLAEALVVVLSDRNKAGFMSENGRRLVEEKYNWNTLMEEEARLYKELV